MDKDRTLHVRIGREISRQELMIYFQSRKQSGGGDISSVDLNESEAVITFEESDVAQNVIGRAPHTINGTKVEVSYQTFTEEFQSEDRSVNKTCIVIVRGLPQDSTEDTVLNYFENSRRSKGGAVEEVKIEGNVARVKFESSEVAQSVVKHDQHILNGASLHVSLELLDNAENTSKTIQITGLTAQSTEDSIRNYFENERRSGGGEVEVVIFRPEENVAFVTFKDVDVAKKVISRTHTLNGTTVEVSCHSIIDEFQAKGGSENQTGVVLAQGLPQNATEDTVLNYFENSGRSGGGAVEEVKIKGTEARVLFESSEVAQSVVKHDQHILNGATPHASFELLDNAENTSKTIQITGLTAQSTEDSIRNYFENERRSGGGEVEAVTFRPEENVALVTFKDVEVAKKVLGRTHTLNGTTVEVSRHSITDKFQAKDGSGDQSRVVIVQGLPQNATEDTVLNYFENSRRSGGGVVEEVKLKGNEARVLFESSEVAQSVLKHDRHILRGATLNVSRELLDNAENTSKTIQITGLTAQSTEDSIRNYFENERRSGGGEVEVVTFRPEENTALVTFKDVEVAKKVLGRTHTLNGTTVEISRHSITDEFQAKDGSGDQSRVVFVQGLPQNATEDTVLNYFENSRRSGGGVVEEVKLKGNVARVLFESSEVAQSVIKHDQHILNGASLHVSLELLDNAENTSKTIQITGLTAQSTEDSIRNYFENERRSGGGEVEAVTFRLEENMALVTFKDVEVAKKVLVRTHTLSGTTVEVSCHSITDEFQAKDGSGDQSRVVFVQGLPQNATEDTVLNYFENSRRSGGGVVEEVKLKGNVARVLFESSEVAQSVVKHDQHILNGATLHVSLELLNNAENTSKTIQITGLTAQSTEDSICNYFENERRSGGGEVEAVTFRPEENMALVTFKDVEVAKKILGRTHTLSGTTVEVSRYSITDEFQAKDGSGDQSRVVFVQGLPQNATEDTVLNYFENSRRSGGGVVEEVKLKGNVARVLFESSEVAQSVLKHDRHILNGATLHVSRELLDNAENTSKTIQITGLTAQSTEDSICNYFENERRSGGGEVEAVTFRPEENMALVTFKDVEVAKKVLNRIHTLNGKTVEVSRHSITDEFHTKDGSGDQTRVVLVQGLPQNATEDTVLNYFENSRRSGGGVVEEVKIKGNEARVLFESSEVAQSVVKHDQHILHGATLHVSFELLNNPENTSKTIQITGLTAQSTEDSICNYFENERRSGGGEVEAVTFRPEENMALVTFKDIGVAEKVLGRTHILNGTTVEVSHHSITDEFHAKDGSGDQTRVVFVQGLPQNATEDTVLNYFENSRRSGGGAVEEVKIKGNVARVRFESSEVAKKVIGKTHTLNGKKVEVSYHSITDEFQAKDGSENQTRVVFVQGLPQNATEDTVLNYFENSRRSGGGAVEEVKIKGNVARVQFESTEVAQRVVKHDQHILNGATLHVSLELLDNAENTSKTIQITGLTAQSTEDSIRNYFENERRSGGGEVEAVTFRPEENVAFVTFKDFEAAKCVLLRDKHILEGAILLVKPTNTAADTLDTAGIQESRTIEVTGLAAKTTKDAILKFFEDQRRSGGGEIEDVVHTPDRGIAIITFTSAETTKSILRQGKHILDGATLNVMITARSPEVEPHNDGVSQESRTIEVTGISAKTTKEAILNFFENKKRSGGGEVESVDHDSDQGTAVITFTTAESARGVLSKRSLTYDGANLTITLKQPPRELPIDSKRLLVKGLSDKTTQDLFQFYMEAVSGVVVLKVEFGGEACAVVTFNEAYDFHTVTKKISVRPLEGKTLIAEQLPVCHCVQVSGFNKETTTEDTIRYYFESPKNNGGDVSSVELNLEEGWALVFFEDPKVVFNVVAGSHFLGGAKLDVSSHCSLLGKPQPVENDVELMQNINVDGKKMQFILEHYKADLTEVENSHDVQITWDEGINSVTVTPKDEALRNKYIFDEACKAITYFLAEFVESSTRVPPEAWDDVVDNFKKSKSPAQQKVRMDCIAEQHVFFFIGKKQEVEEVTKELEGIIVVIDKKLKREASKIECTVKIPYTRLQFLKHLEFAQELESRHEEVEVTILLEKEKLQIRGPPETVDKVRAAIWEAVAKMKDVKLNMSLNALALLKSTPCQVFMRDTLTASNLQAMIAFDERNENVLVVGTESDVAEKAHDLVKTKIVEECVDLDEDQVQLEKSRKWHQLKEEITEKRILTLSFDRGNKKICLVGLKEDVPVAVEAVKRFLAENTIVSTVVTLPKGRRRFLVKYREPELRQIQEDLKEHSTRIKTLADEGKQDLVVSGTTCGVDKAKELIQDLASKVQSQKMPVSKPGMRKMLDGSKGKKLLGMLENENNCVVEYFLPNKGDEKEVKEEKKAEKKKESLYDLLTPDGRKILVFKDNICDRNVDVIVSAANSKLQHVGGVSKAISERAGEAFKAECNRFVTDAGPILDGQVAVTSAGNLPFKKVIHAVGPKWEKKAAQEKSMGRTPREEKILSYAVTSALDAAKDYNSVAIPAISSGIFEFPLELCAEIMVESMLTFFRKNPSCLLSEIQFTSIEDDVVKAFAKELDSRCLNEPTYQSSSDSKRKGKERKKKGKTTSVPNTSSATVSSNTAPNVIKTAEGLQLVLVIGDMSSEEVDVIVNTTSSNLNLSGNASSKALSAAAGPKLQEECKKIGQVKTGEIVVTNGANLACKHVFHTSCPGWEKGQGEKVLRGIIQKCLEEAQKKSLSTISIPAIGTGNLNFPRDCVAEASFDEVLSFSKKNPSSPLKEVHLVVYDKDLQSVQAFQTELQKRSVGPPPLQPAAATAAPKDGKKKRRGLRGGSDKRSEKDTPDGVDVISDEEPILLDPLQPEITIGNIFVQAETGNITKEVTDAIATLSNNELDVALGGGVGKAILAAGGSTIQAECSAMGSQKPDTVVASRAGNLQVRKIYHMVPDRISSMRSISNCILECLRKADSDGLTSISFPAVGTGNINKDAKEAAEGIMAAIFKFAREEPVSIALVRIVIYQPQMLSVFQTAMEASLSSAKSGTGLLSKLAGWIGLGQSGSASSHSMPSMRTFRGKAKPFSYIEIFASTKQDIDTVIKTIEKDAADHCTLKVIEREAICNLSKGQIQQVKKLEAKYDVIVNIEQTIGRISVRGDTEDVLDVATTIYEVLNQKIEEEHARGVGELLSKNVQWFFYDSDDDETPEPYEPSINLQIEEAFGEGKDSVILLIDEEKCEIVFKDMKETCLDSGEVRVVVRKEIGKGVPLPLEWDVQPKDDSGKEKEVHLVLLDPNASEYKKVADKLGKTSPVTIIKIERVQNPSLYRAYVVRREQMELKNGSNEKLLFHGTAGDSCPSINKFGFNRSYCGKNATVYGNGVYFARDASYSTQNKYSPPDATGHRCMYLARVLAGEYTKGRQGMITPPPKGSDATDVYDTVVDNRTDPTIFVVFYDNQCYPDYLITFK